VDIELYSKHGISITDDSMEGKFDLFISHSTFLTMSKTNEWLKSKLHLDSTVSPLDESSKAKLKLGLFSYPVLQAADILVHR